MRAIIKQTAKTAKYFTAYGNNIKDFNAMVNERIEEGWYPYGSPYSIGDVHYQAMLKHEAVNKTASTGPR